MTDLHDTLRANNARIQQYRSAIDQMIAANEDIIAAIESTLVQSRTLATVDA